MMTRSFAALLLVFFSSATLYGQEERFKLSAAEIRKAAAKPLGEKSLYEFLRSDFSYQIHEDGKTTIRTYHEILVRSPQVVDALSNIAIRYSPWYQERPEVRVRVIQPDGETVELNPDELTTGSVSQSATLLTNDLQVKGRIPAVREGSIIQQLFVRKETKPFFAARQVWRVFLTNYSPVHYRRISIEYPVDLPLKFRLNPPQLKITQTTENKTRKLLYEERSIQPQSTWIALPPRETPIQKELCFSTGESWQKVVQAYRQEFEKQIDNEALKSLAEQIKSQAKGKSELVARALLAVRENVRYTGLEFNDRGIIPYKPSDVLRRKYGDCKDQSLLLVNLLRMVGVQANPALVTTRSEPIYDDLPGLGQFNHMIVHVPGDKPLWIDPTAVGYGPDEVPQDLQGRHALVIAADTKSVSKTSWLEATQNTYRRHTRLKFGINLRARLEREINSTGYFAASFRRFFKGPDSKNAYEQNLRREFAFSKPKEISVTGHENGFDAVQIKVVVDDADYLSRDARGVFVGLSAGGILSQLPNYYGLIPAANSKLAPEGKKVDPRYELPVRFRSERSWELIAPFGYEFRDIPQPIKQRFGDVKLDVTTEQKKPTEVTVKAVFDTGSGVLRKKDSDRLKAYMQTLIPPANNPNAQRSVDGWYLRVGLEDVFTKSLIEQKYAKAFALTRPGLAAMKDPEIVTAHINALISVGFLREARALAIKAAKKFPDSGILLQAVGRCYATDAVGAMGTRGADRDKALKYFDEAIKKGGDEFTCRWLSAVLLLREAGGKTSMRKEDWVAARKQLERLRALRLDPNVNAVYYRVLSLLDQPDLIAQLVQQAQPRTNLDDSYLMLSVVMKNGFDAMMRAANQRYPDPNLRRQVLRGVSLVLFDRREYDLCYKIQDELQLPIRIRRKPLDLKTLAADSPKNAALRFVVHNLLNTEFEKGLFSKQVPKDSFSFMRKTTTSRLRNLAITGDTHPEDMITGMEWDVQGNDETGYRIRCTKPQIFLSIFVVKEDGRYVLWATDSMLSRIGLRAHQFEKQGKSQAAVQWLTWGAEDWSVKLPWFQVFTGTPFGRMWMSVNKKQPEHIDVLAAAAMAQGKPALAKLAVATLAAKHDKLPATMKVQADRALSTAYVALQDAEKLREVTDRILANFFDPFTVKLNCQAMRWQGKDSELVDRLQKALKKRPKERRLHWELTNALMRLGKIEEARAAVKKWNEVETVGAGPLIADGWLRLLQGEEIPLELISKMDKAYSTREDFELRRHFMLLLIKGGQFARARQHWLLQSLVREKLEYSPEDLLYLAFYAQECGLDSISQEIKQQIKPTKIPTPLDETDLVKRLLN